MTGRIAEFSILKPKIRQWYLHGIAPAANLLSRRGVHPNVLTLAGLILSIGAGWFYSSGSFLWGGLVVIFAGTCDALDGQMARQTGKDSPFGAFFDSVIDRFGESFIFMGLAWYFCGASAANPEPMHGPLPALIVILALSGSFMVSYTRARAEGLGIDCRAGWMQRPERMVFLIAGSLLGGIAGAEDTVMLLTLFAIAIMSHLTAVQRIIYVRNQMTAKDQAS